MPTKIEWATDTINPLVGCSKISEACRNCYAEKMAYRLKCMGNPTYQNIVDENGWTRKFKIDWSQLDKPLKWKKPRRIFIGSMTDFFHERIDVDSNFYDRVMNRIMRCQNHVFMMLTKRVDKMAWVFKNMFNNELPNNLWIGATLENQDYDHRIATLLSIPAAVRFVSVEPMLSSVGFSYHQLGLCEKGSPCGDHGYISWVIAGAETGPGKRRMDLNWARSLRDQCNAAGVPFFFKKDSNGSHLLDGKAWEQFPEGAQL
jgi:protein gp37